MTISPAVPRKRFLRFLEQMERYRDQLVDLDDPALLDEAEAALADILLGDKLRRRGLDCPRYGD